MRAAFALGLFAGLSAFSAAAEAADLRVSRSRVLVCADTYCGQRSYPDPYIADGWRGSDDRYDRRLDVRTWHRLRTMTPVYVPVPGDRTLF